MRTAQPPLRSLLRSLGLLACFSSGAIAAEREVMIVSSGINAPDTAYLSRNAADLEQVPLDGVATWIATPVPIRVEGGEMYTTRLPGGRLSRIATGEDRADVGQSAVHRRRIPYSHVEPAIGDLRSAHFQRFQSNLIHVITGNALAPMNWYDDAWWEIICHNIGMIARAASEGGCRGILLDPEVYSYPWWGVDQLKDSKTPDRGLQVAYGDRDWEEIASKVRQRGREFAGAICAHLEDPVIMFFTAVGYTAWQVSDPRWDTHETAPYGLMVPFVDGILEGSTDGTVFVDCSSDHKGRSDRSEFEAVARRVRQDGASYSAVPELYRRKVKVGFTFRLGYHPREEEISGPNRISGLFDSAWPDANFYSPRRLEEVLKLALEIGDGYVLFWNFRANWWLSDVLQRPADRAPVNPMTRWVPPAYWEAIERARAAARR